MPKAGKRRKPKDRPETLEGWKAIGEYLGIGAATAQRWAKGGMPVQRQGRFTVANTEEIRKWLGREAHMPAPAHVVTDTGDDISAALKESPPSADRARSDFMLQDVCRPLRYFLGATPASVTFASATPGTLRA